ncbi:hypothetical protein PU683_01235 [Kosakonia cowanii]|uniref:hypothetical protein n=1 Tax=Kosakonia cowanii TaxID=208223 RepID=UPI0023F8F46B|nr:hypothetical protein [Kosakonia cowanii]MDF7758155.1 hypothetical protein [Kosakonia cowanii]
MASHQCRMGNSNKSNHNSGILITLYHARRDIICSGIVGFLLAILSTFYYPQQWLTSLTISSAEKFTLYPLMACIQNFYGAEVVIEADDFFNDYLIYLKKVIARGEWQDIFLDDTNPNQIRISLLSWFPGAQNTSIQLVLQQANNEQQSMINEISKCSIEDINHTFYRIDNDSYQLYPVRMRYSIRMFFATAMGVISISLFFLLREKWRQLKSNFYYQRNEEVMERNNHKPDSFKENYTEEEYWQDEEDNKKKKIPEGTVAAITIYLIMLVVSLIWLGLEIYTGL